MPSQSSDGPMPRLDHVQVTVLVLGDVGRSPRMQYQALALADSGAAVDLVAYADSAPHQAVRDHPRITLHALRPFLVNLRRRLPRPLFLVSAVVMVVSQCVQILWALLRVRKPDFILVQNPPAIPTLVLALLVSWLRSAKFVIDWHNFGYTMLSLKLGSRHPAVRVARWYESLVSRGASEHFCVSKAMQQELRQGWDLAGAIVLYDRPAAIFAPTPLHVRHDLFHRLRDVIAMPEAGCHADAREGSEQRHNDVYQERTLLTTLSVPNDRMRGEVARYCSRRQSESAAAPIAPAPELLPFVQLRQDRPAIIVSSTSWTPDEDFSLLLEAIERCDERIRTQEESSGNDPRGARPFPHLLFFITGKGPLRALYEEQIGRLALRNIHLRTLWLKAEDYPLLLGAADLGICLHRSTSGLDLPMKVADMFGAGLPVCAFDYGPCLAEMVRHGEDGLLFSTGEQLAEQLYDLFRGFPSATPLLDFLRQNVAGHHRQSWFDGWKDVAEPVFCND